MSDKTIKLYKRYDHKSKDNAELFIQGVEACCADTTDKVDHFLEKG